MKRRNLVLGGAVALVVFLMLLRLVRVAGAGPAVALAPAPAATSTATSMDALLHPDAEISGMVHHACYNCHSDRPNFPWYANVWPSSYLVRHDRRSGLARLNFSEWDRLDPEMSKVRLMDSCTMMREDKMPLWYYRPLHPEAHLSQQEIQHFCDWASGLPN